MNKNFKIFTLFLFAILVSIFCIGFGSVKIESISIFKIIVNKIGSSEYFTPTWSKPIENIVWNIRVPRIILAFITGASLSLVGIIMQTITGNSLAEPYILGLSSGASTGAVSVIILSETYRFLKLISIKQGAFIGAIVSILIVFLLSSKKIFKGSSLILTGVGVSSFFTACTTIIIYGSKNNSQLVTAMFWMTGSLSSAQWKELLSPLIFLGILLITLIFYSRDLDIFLIGEGSAKSLGINTTLIKCILLALSTLLTSVIVSLTGIIGFVGLVIPHISRKIVGYKHLEITIFSTFGGGVFLVICDTFARTYFSPEEMPIGIITAFIGTPIFLWIIRKKHL